MPDIQIEKIEPEQIKTTLEFSQQGIGKLTEAIAKARPKFGIIKKSAENPFYKDAHGKPRKYADLAEIIAATAEPLAEEGLYAFQAPFIESGKMVGIITLLSHSSGEWLKTTITGCPADQKLKEGGSRFDAQTIGIGFTYLARYGMRAILNLGSEDDDGQGLVSQHSEPKKPLQIKGSAQIIQDASEIPGVKSRTSSLSELANVSRTAMGNIIVSPEAIKVEGTVVATATADEDGCPLSDTEIPKNLQLPTPEQLREFGTTLKALKQDSRLLKQWFEREAGSEWKKIPYVKFQPIIDKLKLAEKEGKLTGLITNF